MISCPPAWPGACRSWSALLRHKARQGWERWRQRADELILPGRRRDLLLALWLERRSEHNLERPLIAR